MKVVFRRVFYCEFCGKHRLRSDVIQKHEETCTLNPARVCRWDLNGGDRHHFDLTLIARRLRENGPIDEGDLTWLETQVKGCPACMLSAIRLSGLKTSLFDMNRQAEKINVKRIESLGRSI